VENCDIPFSFRIVCKRQETTEDFVFIRMDKDNYQMLIATMEARTGKPAEKMLED
jgi:hypothetical protein